MNENGQFDAGTDNLLAEFDYTVRDDGRRSGAVEKYFDDGGTTPFEQNAFTWSYDDLGRLIGEVLDSSDNTLDYTDTFEWDIVGNRLETSRDWGDVANDDYTTTYQYDANDRLTVETKDHVATSVPDVVTTYSYDHTQQTGKSVVTDGVPTSNQLFEYDLQGRMASVTNQTLDSGGNVVGVQTTEYEYDTAGNRVIATNTVDADNDGTPESVTRTEYLTDANNPTGYSQVIEETEFDDQGNPTKKVVYTIGHDQISQTVFTHDGTNWDSGETHHFGYDGHGSVRVLYDAMASMVTSATTNILQLFHFDAHGNLLNMQAVEALTSYLYSGEAFDSNIGQQYLRARWYDATTGRFNRRDPFFGNLSDPQSLHKYLYVHSDPVNGVDPSGLFTSSQSFSTITTRLSLQKLGNYLWRQTLTSVIQTSLEYVVLKSLFPDANFDLIRTFSTNLAVNVLTGRVKSFWLRNLFDIALNTGVDGLHGENVAASLLMNVVGSFGGEILGAVGGSLINRIRRAGRGNVTSIPDFGAGIRKGLLPDAPIGIGEGVQRVLERRRNFAVRGKSNVAFAEMDTGTGDVVELFAASGDINRRGCISPPGQPGGISELQRRFYTHKIKGPDGNIGDNDRLFDAEVVLLEQIANSIPSSSNGTVRLFSQFPICDSCDNVIRQFRQQFPGIRLHVSSDLTKPF